MFQELLQQAKANIDTVRSIVNTNENLRTAISQDKKQRKSKGYIELLTLIKKDIPENKEWYIYEHCSVVTKLYAIYENFVENLIRDWLVLLPSIVSNYSDLDTVIRNTHSHRVGRLLREKDKKRYEKLSIEKIINGLYLGINNNEEYELVPEAFLFHEQNLRKNILEQLLINADISNSWTWINKGAKPQL